ncbi:PspC domain-containing protein, partial [Saccharomonospora iraqiensis]|uniref:PspC domain-containing protein n=1 Tax=Saccharomonospora iraqiensis TaxID=52698 RepID=UPI0012FABC33
GAETWARDTAGDTAGRTAGDTGRAKLYRRRTGRALAGVAAGIADHLGVRVVWVRAAFAVLSGFGGMGMLAYGLLWAFVPQSDREAAPPETPEAGTRSAAASRVERQQAYGLMVLGVAMAVAGGTVSGVFSGWLGLPVAVALVGAAVVWREADESQRRR